MKNLLKLILIFFISFNSDAFYTESDNDIKDVIKNLKYRNVGPTRGGRVTTVHGVESEKNVFYMGTTGGGVWKTTDFGNNWFNVSDGYFKSPSIGAINVYQKDPNIVYVGTGSDGLRSNIIVGKGIYRSEDAGKSWDHIGLEDVGQIGAVEIHPDDPNTLYVAAIGQPFKKNEERGLYKSIDGGKSWDKVLYLSDSIGIVDVEFAPDDPNTLYAASWRTERKPWTIISGSTNGGAYKSVDSGKTWKKIDLGIDAQYIGKIDFAVSKSKPNRLFMMIEASEDKGGLYKSEDRGVSFEHMNNREELVNRPFYYLNVESNPLNSDILYSSANRFMISKDAGKTWKSYSTPHGDNHDIWINPSDTSVWIQSNDGGANITFNSGKTWTTQFNQPTAEIYQVEVDDQYPYWLYGGQQDNYSTVSVPSLPPYGLQAGPNAYITNTGGCETGPAVPNPLNPNIVYSNCKGKFGVYNKETGSLEYNRKLQPGPGDSMYGLEVCKSLHLPDDFLQMAYEIREKRKPFYKPVSEYDCSHFNQKKVVGKCEKCGKVPATEVHHLQHQKYANKDNKYINTFNKNHLANLTVVCQECHDKFHEDDRQYKKITTSVGVEIVQI